MHLSGEGRAVLPGRSENFWAETTVELGLEGRGMQEKAGSPGRGESVRTGVRQPGESGSGVRGRARGAWCGGSQSWGLTSQAMSVVLVYVLMCVGPFLFFLVNSPVLWSIHIFRVFVFSGF